MVSKCFTRHTLKPLPCAGEYGGQSIHDSSAASLCGLFNNGRLRRRSARTRTGWGGDVSDRVCFAAVVRWHVGRATVGAGPGDGSSAFHPALQFLHPSVALLCQCGCFATCRVRPARLGFSVFGATGNNRSLGLPLFFRSPVLALLRVVPTHRVALTFGIGMSNNGTGLLIAAAALPDHPLVLLPCCSTTSFNISLPVG